METFVTVMHILTALVLIALVLLQDTKSGSVGGAFGGGGSSSVLGATGAATLAQQLTRGVAVLFAATSIMLSVFAAHSQKSVMDSVMPVAPAPISAAPNTGAPVPAPEQAAPGKTSPAAPDQSSPAAPANK